MNRLNLAFLAPFVMAWNSIKQFFNRCGSIFVANGELRGQLAAAFENTCIQAAMECYWQHHLTEKKQ